MTTIHFVPPLSRVHRQLDAARVVLARLDEATVAELHRRAGTSPTPLEEGPGLALADGYGTGRHTDELPRGGSADATPVERAAVLEADDPRAAPEAVTAALSRIFAHLVEVTGLLVAIDRDRDFVLSLGESERGRRSSVAGACRCCDRTVTGLPHDRLRNEYCEACNRAWDRSGRPGADPQEPIGRRRRWEAERRSELAERAS